MHRRYLQYPGARGEDQWIVTDSVSRVTRARLISPHGGSKVAFLPDVDVASVSGMRAIRVEEVSGLSRLAEILESAQKLQYLSIPACIADSVLGSPLPRALSVLRFSGSEIARVPAGVVLDGIERVIGQRIDCRAEQFPSLKHLDMEVEEASAPLICGTKGLETLNLRSLREQRILERLEARGLVFLGLRGGAANLVEGVRRRLPSIEELWIQDFTGLLPLAYLASLQELRELTVGYCQKISGLETLLDLPKLDAVHFFGCGEIGIGTFRARLIDRLSEVRIDGTT